MKKILTMTVIGTMFGILAASPTVYADSVQDDQQDVQADKGAVHKDNRALAKDRDALENNRAAKADDKANGNYGKQAKDSLAIGADQTEIGEKKTEKKVDKKILEHHKKELNEDAANTEK